MSIISLTDNSSASLNATVLDTSLIGKTPASVIHFLRADILGAMNQTLDQVQINMVSAGFSFLPSFTLGGGTATFEAGGGLTGEIDLFKPSTSGGSSPLFPADQFGTCIEIGDSIYLALGFQLGVKAEADGAAGLFWIEPVVTSIASAKLYLPFRRNRDGYPTLKDALASLCASYAFPSTIDDLRRMTLGSVLAFDASGTIGFNATLDLLAAVNPTATPGVSQNFGPVSINAGPSVTVGGGFTLSGELEVRIWKKSDSVVQIGYYKKRGASFSLSFDASVAVDVKMGHYDVLAKVYDLLGDSGKLDETWLKNNIPSSVALETESAYEAAVQKKVSIAIDSECDTSITDQAAFSWNFDLSSIDAEGASAFTSAIKGDLSQLMSGNGLPRGISKAGSVFDKLKETKHVFTFNFLGLFDHASVNDSIVDICCKVSEDGQLILTDTAHLTRLAADATPFVKSDQLRKVFAEDCVATVGYVAGCGSLAPSLKVNYSYFDYESRAKVSDLLRFIATAKQLGESVKPDDWAQILQAAAISQQAHFLAELSYDNQTSRELFVNQSSIARIVDDYERIGRVATLNTPGIGLSDAFAPWLDDDSKWKRIRDAGTMQNFFSILGVDQISPPPWAPVSFAWTLHIIFWAAAMHSAGGAFQDLSEFLMSNVGSISWQDPGFTKRRQTFASQLNTAIQKAPLFHDALGLLIMFNAARPTGTRVTIRYGGLSKSYN